MERRIDLEIPVSEFQFYDVISRKKGEFGYTSAAVSEKEREERLVYRDCKILPEQKYLILHLMSGAEGEIEVRIGGKRAAAFKGKTGIYRDVRLEMDCDLKALPETVEVEIRLKRDVKLCYFRME